MKRRKFFHIVEPGKAAARIENTATTRGWEHSKIFLVGSPVIHFTNQAVKSVNAFCTNLHPFVISGDISADEISKVKKIVAESSVSGVIIPDAFMVNFNHMKEWFLRQIAPGIHDPNPLFFTTFEQTFGTGGTMTIEHKFSHGKSIHLKEWDLDLAKLRHEYLERLEKEMSLGSTTHCKGGSKFKMSARDFGLAKLEITDPFVDVAGVESIYKALEFLYELKGKERKGNLYMLTYGIAGDKIRFVKV